VSDTNDLDFGQTIRGFAEGQKVFGRYVLKRILGRGGMGIVWLAWDEKLERDIALKFMPEMVRLDASAVDELKRETRKSLSLTHTNIVRIFDYVDDGQSAAIAMEYIDGATLSALRVQKPGRVFEVNELRGWVAQACEALAYAHDEARVVHRDLKPANLMVTSGGRLKVTDFGIARSICDSASRMSVAVGNSSGTLVYMSPQQLDGDNPSALDDIYSLGATLYELLTSRPPFSSGNIYAQVKEKIPPPMSERRTALEVEGQPISAHWETTIAACLAKEPARRPQSVREVLQGLEGKLPPPAPELPPDLNPPPPDANPPVQTRKPWRLLVGTGLVVSLAGGAYFFFGTHVPAAKALLEESEKRQAAFAAQAVERVAEERTTAERARLQQEQAAERLRLEKAQAETEAASKALALREAQAKIDAKAQTVRQAIADEQWSAATGELAELVALDADPNLVASLRATIASGIQKQQANLGARMDSVAAEIRTTLQSGVGSYGFSVDLKTGICSIELKESARAVHVIQEFDPRTLETADAVVSKVGGGFFRDQYSVNIPTRQNREVVRVVNPAIPDMSEGSPTSASDHISFHTDDESHARFAIGRLKVLAQLVTDSGAPAMADTRPTIERPANTPRPTATATPRPSPSNQELMVAPFVRRAVIEDPDGYTNVRQGASKTSSIIARMNNGEVFYTYPQADGWWRIRTASGTVGFMHNSRIRLQK